MHELGKQFRFDAAHSLERAIDADRKGVAVVIELDLVSGRDLEMRR